VRAEASQRQTYNVTAEERLTPKVEKHFASLLMLELSLAG